MSAIWIVATAAVRPSPGVRAVIADPQVRAEQYRKAIAHWAEVATGIGAALAIVETTGGEMAALSGTRDSSVACFHPSVDLVQRGKGAIEAAAIDHLVRAREIPDVDTICKITGRLIVQNAAQLVRRVDENTAIVRRTLDRRYCDTRFLLTSAGCWRRHLSGMGLEIDDPAGRYLEHVLAHRLSEAEYRHGTVVARFPSPPIIRGVSGTSGSRYGSPISRLGNPLRAQLESLFVRLAPKQV